MDGTNNHAFASRVCAMVFSGCYGSSFSLNAFDQERKKALTFISEVRHCRETERNQLSLFEGPERTRFTRRGRRRRREKIKTCLDDHSNERRTREKSSDSFM